MPGPSNAAPLLLPSMRFIVLPFMTALLLPCWGAAQSLVGFGGSVGQADLLYFSGHPQEAYEILERHLEEHPEDYDALWRAVRAAVVVGIAREGVVEQNYWLDPAIVLGDRAVQARPEGVDGLYWRGAAAGRRALNAGPSYAADLAQRVYDDAHAILAQNPLHGGAHNLLGKLNYEIMSLSRVERFIGRVLVRKEALRQSSWEQAEFHLSAAAREWPDYVVFHFDLAQYYRKRDRKEEARGAFERAVDLPVVHPPDDRFQADARRFLDELGSE